MKVTRLFEYTYAYARWAHMHRQGGNSSANWLNSAISEAIWMIFQISVNLQRKQMGWGIGANHHFVAILHEVFF